MLFILLENLAYAEESSQVITTADYVGIATNIGGIGGFAGMVYLRQKEIGIQLNDKMEKLSKEIAARASDLRREILEEIKGIRSEMKDHTENDIAQLKEFVASTVENGGKIDRLLQRLNLVKK